MLATVLASPLAVGPATGPILDVVLKTIFTIDQGIRSSFPSECVVLLLATSVALGDSPEDPLFAYN